MSRYAEEGYNSRREYLDDLADNYGDAVYALADILGPSEDFDGLLASLEDMSG